MQNDFSGMKSQIYMEVLVAILRENYLISSEFRLYRRYKYFVCKIIYQYFNDCKYFVYKIRWRGIEGVAMNYDQLKLDKQLCHRLYMASNGLVRTYRPLLDALNLTYPQYVVMMALWEQDGITIQTLLEKTVIDGGAMTLILKKMKEKNLLSITPSESDKRKKLIHLQPEGQALKQKAADIPEKIQCAFPSIQKPELMQLITLLDLVCADLNELSEKDS